MLVVLAGGALLEGFVSPDLYVSRTRAWWSRARCECACGEVAAVTSGA